MGLGARTATTFHFEAVNIFYRAESVAKRGKRSCCNFTTRVGYVICPACAESETKLTDEAK